MYNATDNFDLLMELLARDLLQCKHTWYCHFRFVTFVVSWVSRYGYFHSIMVHLKWGVTRNHVFSISTQMNMDTHARTRCSRECWYTIYSQTFQYLSVYLLILLHHIALHSVFLSTTSIKISTIWSNICSNKYTVYGECVFVSMRIRFEFEFEFELKTLLIQVSDQHRFSCHVISLVSAYPLNEREHMYILILHLN